MELKEMIQLNNEKRKLLTKENELAYGDMLVYIRCSNVPEHQSEELLLEILEHLLEAQKEEKTAYDVFGNNLQSYCDELIAALPRQSLHEKLTLIGFIASLLLAIDFGIGTLSSLIVSIYKKTIQSVPFDILGSLSSVIILTIVLFIILHLIKSFSFGPIDWKKRIKFVLSFTVPLVLVVFFNIYIKKYFYLSYSLTLWQGALVTLLFFILYKILFKVSKF